MKRFKFVSVLTLLVLFFSSFSINSQLVHAGTVGKQPIVKVDNVQINQGDSVNLNDHLEELTNLDEGSIVIRYHTKSNDLMTLFSVSNNNEANTYFSLYVWGGKIGSEHRTPGQADVHLSKETSLLKADEVHTVVMTADKSKGYSYYVDGEKVLENNTSDVRFLNTIAGVNQSRIGKTERSGGNMYLFSGAIDFAEVYAEPLSDEEAIAISEATYSEQPTVEMPEGAKLTEPQDIFYPGYMDSNAYRIPALLYTKKGTLIAGIDRRIPGGWDSPNDIDSMIRRSHDNGDTWEKDGIIVKSYPKNGSNIDMAMVQDEKTERIYLLVTTFPDGAGLMGGNSLKGSGYKEIDGKRYLMLRNENENEFTYTVRENGVVYDDATNTPTNYTVDQARDLYEDGKKIDNIFSSSAPLKPFKTSYLELYYSDDEGESWSDPVDINPETKEEYMSFLGTGPGNGIQLKEGEHKGRIVFPVYFFNDNNKQASAIVYSDDGETWHRGESPNEGRDVGNGQIIYEKDFNDSGHELTESQVVEMPDGQLKLFMRNYSGRARIATSLDGGETWLPEVVMEDELVAPYSQMSAIRYNGQIDGKEAIIFASANNPNSRVNGTVRVGLIEEDGTYENGRTKYRFDWKYEQLIKEGHYGYSNLANINDGEIGLHYEGTGSEEMSFIKFNVDFLKWEKVLVKPEATVKSMSIVSDSLPVVPGDSISVEVEFNDYVMLIGNKKLIGTIGGTDIDFTLTEQIDNETFLFTSEIPEIDDGEYELQVKFAPDLTIYNSFGSVLNKDVEANQLYATLVVEGEETPETPEQPELPKWIVGTGNPTDVEGNKGDLFLNSENGDIFQKTGEGWILVANIQGPPGEDGSDGKDGEDGSDGKDGEDGSDGKDGEDGSDGKDGVDGSDGKDGVDGTDGKDGEDGSDGKDGADGTDGKDGVDGSDGKDGADGTDGKDGVDGSDGKDGADGTDGKDGATWIVGKGKPTEQVGEVGDLYLDTQSRKIYLKNTSGWDYEATLRVETIPCDCDEEDNSGIGEENGVAGVENNEELGTDDQKNDGETSGEKTDETNPSGIDNSTPGPSNKLPKTATNTFNLLLFGLSLMIIGSFVLVVRKRKSNN